MKLSAYYKSLGADVELKLDYENLDAYDTVTISKVFMDTEIPCEPEDKSLKTEESIALFYKDNPVLNSPNVEYGGTGFYYDKAPALPDEIEHIMPDYHLYDEWVAQQIENGTKPKDLTYYTDYSIGFTTRGCIRGCKFCVNKNYKKCVLHSPVREFVDESRPYICLLDDNVLACADWRKVFDDLAEVGKCAKFKQGVDERLLTDEKCEALFGCKHVGRRVFAFDNIKDKDLIISKLEMIRRHTEQSVQFYTFCAFNHNKPYHYDKEFWGNDIRELFERIKILMTYNCLPYVMKYKDYELSPYRGLYILIARWCNQPAFLNKKTLREFAIANQKGVKPECASMRYIREFETDFPDIAREYFDTRFAKLNMYRGQTDVKSATDLQQTGIESKAGVTDEVETPQSLEKEKLTLIELFSGIGSQVRGINNTGLWDCEVVNVAEIDKDAMLSYAAMHCGLTPELLDNYTDYPTEQAMIQYLADRNIGFNFARKQPFNWGKLAKQKPKDLKKYYLACVLTHNLGDISGIEELNYADFWTYSFPCQDISAAGKQAGIVKGKTRSGLLYEVERLLEKAIDKGKQPKYLLLENVKNLVGKQFKPQFYNWLYRLDELGYNTYWSIVNGKDCGIPQNRERVFALSIRRDIDRYHFNFAKPFDIGVRLKDIMLNEVDEKYFLSETMQERFTLTDTSLTKSIIGSTKSEVQSIGQRYLVYQQNTYIGALQASDYKQPKQVLANQTECEEYLTTATDKESIHKEHIYRIRKLTPTECWRLMGFTDDDVAKAKAMGVSDTAIYKQAGNSIITNCISLIAEHLYKAQIDFEHVCFDEQFYKLAGLTEEDVIELGHKPRLVGGIGEINFGNQYRQGNRVYSADDVAMACLAQPLGNAGGFSYLYLVNNKVADENKVVKLGNIYPSGGQNGNIYSARGLSPTISSGATDTAGNGGVGSNNAPKVLIDDLYKNRDERVYVDYAPALRAERQGLKVCEFVDNNNNNNNVEQDPIAETNTDEVKADRLKVIDFFCGMGGASLGYERSGCEVILAIDKWGDALQTHAHNLKDVPVMECDIKELDLSKLPKADIYHLSPPCQSFSTAGKQDGLDGKTGDLFQVALNVLDKQRPNMFIIENVRGLYKHIQRALDDLSSEGKKGGIFKGFDEYDITPILLNAKDCGVCQWRERVFIIGIKKTFGRFSPSMYIPNCQTFEDVITAVKGRNEGIPIHSPEVVEKLSYIPQGGCVMDIPENIRPKCFKNSYSRLCVTELPPTITRNYNCPSSANCIHPYEHRGLSDTEALYIQGFPLDWAVQGSKKNLQIGNAIPPQMIEWIMSGVYLK